MCVAVGSKKYYPKGLMVKFFKNIFFASRIPFCLRAIARSGLLCLKNLIDADF